MALFAQPCLHARCKIQRVSAKPVWAGNALVGANRTVLRGPRYLGGVRCTRTRWCSVGPNARAIVLLVLWKRKLKGKKKKKKHVEKTHMWRGDRHMYKLELRTGWMLIGACALVLGMKALGAASAAGNEKRWLQVTLNSKGLNKYTWVKLAHLYANGFWNLRC